MSNLSFVSPSRNSPWGTYLSGEENFRFYFSGGDQPDAHQRRWGMVRTAFFGWPAFDERFDATKHPNEFNRFGWVVELDPADPTRNPRRKRGMYGTFNRAYAAEIAEGMGKQVVLNFAYEAPDVYPAGARIERIITLKAGEEFFTVDYRITPKASSNGSGNFKQAFWSASSIAVGDPANKARKFLSANGAFDFAVAKTRALNVASGWVAAAIDGQNTFGVLWRDAEVSTAEIEMKEFSSFVNVKFAPFAIGATEQTHTYRLAFYLGALPPERLAAERARLLQ